MKTLKEHEEAAVRRNAPPPSPFRFSDVACPDCQEELFGDPNDYRLSDPPKGQVRCKNGHYHYLTLPIMWMGVYATETGERIVVERELRHYGLDGIMAKSDVKSDVKGGPCECVGAHLASCPWANL